jgi:colanic acid/amylovoran biosynthesis glycosyltransferase
MRIAYCLLQFPVLSQTFIINEIVELIRLGHEVHIFSTTRPGSSLSKPQVEEYDLLSRTHYLPVFATIAKHLPEPQCVPDPLRDIYNATRARMRFAEEMVDVTAAAHFARLAENLDIEVLHSHFHGAGSALTALVARRAGLPFTFTCHAVDIFVDPDPEVMRRHMDAAHRVITVSNYNQQYLQALTGVDDRRTTVIRACSDLERFAHLERRGDGQTILSVGRLVEKKGLRYGIEALARLLPEFPGLRYRVLGAGPLLQDLTSLALALGVADRVEFTGAVDQNEVMRSLETATVMVLPCVRAANGDLDGAPLALQEAMAAGVPVVATSVASIPELIRDEREGLLVAPHDVSALANAIRRQLVDLQAALAMAQAARARVREQFSIHIEAGKLVRVWEDALSQREAQPSHSAELLRTAGRASFT